MAFAVIGTALACTARCVNDTRTTCGTWGGANASRLYRHSLSGRHRGGRPVRGSPAVELPVARHDYGERFVGELPAEFSSLESR